jgi:hypothetical protein
MVGAGVSVGAEVGPPPPQLHNNSVSNIIASFIGALSREESALGEWLEVISSLQRKEFYQRSREISCQRTELAQDAPGGSEQGKPHQAGTWECLAVAPV